MSGELPGPAQDKMQLSVLSHHMNRDLAAAGVGGNQNAQAASSRDQASRGENRSNSNWCGQIVTIGGVCASGVGAKAIDRHHPASADFIVAGDDAGFLRLRQ
jgi:hypothetical protein